MLAVCFWALFVRGEKHKKKTKKKQHQQFEKHIIWKCDSCNLTIFWLICCVNVRRSKQATTTLTECYSYSLAFIGYQKKKTHSIALFSFLEPPNSQRLSIAENHFTVIQQRISPLYLSLFDRLRFCMHVYVCMYALFVPCQNGRRWASPLDTIPNPKPKTSLHKRNELVKWQCGWAPAISQNYSIQFIWLD